MTRLTAIKWRKPSSRPSRPIRTWWNNEPRPKRTSHRHLRQRHRRADCCAANSPRAANRESDLSRRYRARALRDEIARHGGALCLRRYSVSLAAKCEGGRGRLQYLLGLGLADARKKIRGPCFWGHPPWRARGAGLNAHPA